MLWDACEAVSFFSAPVERLTLAVTGVSFYSPYRTGYPVTSQMNFDHYTDAPVDLAVDLVNTYGWVSGTDSLTSVADLERFLAERAGPLTDGLASPTAADVDSIRRLRKDLHDVFMADDAGRAADILNRILDSGGARPHLSLHGGPAHMHFEPSAADLASWMAVVTAMGVATVLADHGLERLGTCQADDCQDAFVDTSRNRSRRHCSTTCSNREHVAAHRRRQRSQ
jgi:predicted RNA-binding Zn ribbon-like protein